jgi:hypothetical protein
VFFKSLLFSFSENCKTVLCNCHHKSHISKFVSSDPALSLCVNEFISKVEVKLGQSSKSFNEKKSFFMCSNCHDSSSFGLKMIRFFLLLLFFRVRILYSGRTTTCKAPVARCTRRRCRQLSRE